MIAASYADSTTVPEQLGDSTDPTTEARHNGLENHWMMPAP